MYFGILNSTRERKNLIDYIHLVFLFRLIVGLFRLKYFQIFEKSGEIFSSEQQVDQTPINESRAEESGGGQLQK